MPETWKEAAFGLWVLALANLVNVVIMIRWIARLEYRISRLGG